MLHLENFFEKSFALLLTTPIFVRHATNCLPSNTKYDIIRNREKDSVLPMFGHTKEASVLWHWAFLFCSAKNCLRSSCVSS